MNKQLPDAIEDIKSLVQKGELPTPRDLKHAAALRLSHTYILNQEMNARNTIQKTFRNVHPLLDVNEVEYYRHMLMNIGDPSLQ